MGEPGPGPGQTDEDDGDYDYTSKWEYLGQGIWENQVRSPGVITDMSTEQPPGLQDYGTLSNYSTLKSGVGRDYDTTSGVVSEEELER